MAILRYIGSLLLILLIILAALLNLPFFILGVMWGAATTAFVAGRVLIVDSIINKSGMGRAAKRPDLRAR